MNTKKYDSRTHEEKRTALTTAFERLKIRALATGKISICSIKKICKEADVSDTYLYTDKLGSEKDNAKYHKIRDEILAFKKSFKDGIQDIQIDTELGRAQEEKIKLKNERDSAHLQYLEVLQQVEGLKRMVIQQKKRIKENADEAVSVAAINIQKSKYDSKAPSFPQVNIVSPDSHLLVGGKYCFDDKNLRNLAWRTSVHQFEELLKRPLSQRVYILVGPPCAGKSEWCKTSDYYPDRHPVVVDSTNLTKSVRANWFNVIYKYKHKNDIKMCAVFFDVPFDVLQKRNNMRSPDKRLDDELLLTKLKTLEPVDIYEGFDEIKVIRYDG